MFFSATASEIARRSNALITLGPSRLMVLVAASKLASSISGICLMQTAILSTAILLVPTRLVERAAPMQQSVAYPRRYDQVISRGGFVSSGGHRRALRVCNRAGLAGGRGRSNANRVAGAERDRDFVRARRGTRGRRCLAVLRLPAAGARFAAGWFFSDAESRGDHRAASHAGRRA